MIYERLAELLSYPRAERPPQAIAEEALSEAPMAAAGHLAAFIQEFRALSTEEQQERYVTTFELNPACSLEIGWHLYGENYERGEFLVKMRQEMQRLGITESSELPDHLTHALAIFAKFEREEAEAYTAEYLYPALKRMPGLDGTNAYRHVLAALEAALEADYPEAAHYEPRPEMFPILQEQEEVAHDW